MKIDLTKGVYIQVEGELGKYHSLPIDVLVKIAQELQNLLFALAKFDLPSKDSVDLNNLKIELVDFKKGSAIPQFAYSPRSENMCGMFWKENRQQVNSKFEKIIEISDSGDYTKLFDVYPVPEIRNHIVENLYSFTNSFGTAPVRIVDYMEEGKIITPIFQIKKFKSKVKNSLIGKVKEDVPSVPSSIEVVGRIKVTNTPAGNESLKIIEHFPDKKYSLEYAPDTITCGSVNYFLKYPLRCLFEKEEDYYVIQSELLGIIGTGVTKDEAEQSFSDEFDFVYNRLNSLDDSQLSLHNKFIKANINHIVEKIDK